MSAANNQAREYRLAGAIHDSPRCVVSHLLREAYSNDAVS